MGPDGLEGVHSVSRPYFMVCTYASLWSWAVLLMSASILHRCLNQVCRPARPGPSKTRQTGLNDTQERETCRIRRGIRGEYQLRPRKSNETLKPKTQEPDFVYRLSCQAARRAESLLLEVRPHVFFDEV